MDKWYIWSAVAVIALVTAAIRFAPFLIWGGSKKPPKFIENLGKMLPCAIMGMLVVYCLKDVRFTAIGNFLPQMLACLVVGVLHVWKRNTLLSILAGTICYMLLVQQVF